MQKIRVAFSLFSLDERRVRSLSIVGGRKEAFLANIECFVRSRNSYFDIHDSLFVTALKSMILLVSLEKKSQHARNKVTLSISCIKNQARLHFSEEKVLTVQKSAAHFLS